MKHKSLKKGDIVVYPFPFSDKNKTKLRPSLILSEEINGDVLLCQITSKTPIRSNYSVFLKKENTFGENLRVDSYIKTNKLFTGNTRNVLKNLCSVNEDVYSSVVQKINLLICKT